MTGCPARGESWRARGKVARPSGVSRPYLYYVAVRDSLYLAARRRGLRPALRELRTRAYPSWIAHQFAYPGLPRTELHTRYADLLLGATVVDHRHACAVHWQGPATRLVPEPPPEAGI